jgi:hypothetical protein
MKQSTAMIDNHEIVASHPGESQLSLECYSRNEPTREVAQQTLCRSWSELADPMVLAACGLSSKIVSAVNLFAAGVSKLLPEPSMPSRRETKR